MRNSSHKSKGLHWQVKLALGLCLSAMFIVFQLANAASTTKPITTTPATTATTASPATTATPGPTAANTRLQQYLQSKPAKRISLNFTNISTRELLQILAQFTGKNFIISDKVKGSMSIHLKNIPWPQALEVILKSQSLAQREIGNSVIIAPGSDISAEQIQEIQNQQQLAKLKTAGKIQKLESNQKLNSLTPLYNKVFILKYAKAEDIKKLLTETGNLLTARGSMGFDNQTNSIWIRDTKKHLATITRLLRKLDFPAKQVEIKARIVSIQRPYERQLGLMWGVTNANNNLSGTLQGANDIVAGAVPSAVTPISRRLNFNIPAAAISGANPATFGLALAQIHNFNIDVEISALEREGKIHLISAPRLVTSNLEPAYIETGEEIPYQQATSSGATAIEFKNAALKLEVTPRITPDHRVLLKVKVSNNRQGTQVALADGSSFVPIDTEEEESRVLMNNGQTIVIGGVYTQDKRKVVTRIPFLGSIPIVGNLFRHTLTRNDRDELLIFLTPKIIDKPAELSKE
ncbi:MAG: type IV pilus secretin PilQ [Gammaproteobacteria bacterium]|nr:type IV pilus secretin PilQ [Gammaproteobacteria bacterium]